MSPVHEFPHPVQAAKIGHEPMTIGFKADEHQCALLARRYNILSVENVVGTASLHREADGMTIGVRGTFTADVTQACVTTLEPVPDHIEEDFEGWYLDESQASSFKRAQKRRIEKDEDDIFDEAEDHIADERDDPEPVVGGLVDVGELVAQYLSLALNPFPHSEKALKEGPVGDEAELKKPNPFAILKDLKTK